MRFAFDAAEVSRIHTQFAAFIHFFDDSHVALDVAYDQLLKAAVNGHSLFIAELLDEGASVEYKDMVRHVWCVFRGCWICHHESM